MVDQDVPQAGSRRQLQSGGDDIAREMDMSMDIGSWLPLPYVEGLNATMLTCKFVMYDSGKLTVTVTHTPLPDIPLPLGIELRNAQLGASL